MTTSTAEDMNSHAVLLDLITGLVAIENESLPELQAIVTGIQIDSRRLRKGDLFIAYFGRNHDARDFIADAIQQDVAAVLAESGGEWQGIRVVDGKLVVAIDNLTAKISEIAARFYGKPSEELTVFGITGTNGKTSCTQFLAQLLQTGGENCGVIGTLGYGPYEDLLETELTTPDAVFTQMALAELSHRNVNPVAIEVSSVGLHQKRVAAVNFDTAVFTNLTRDHLDYHECMEAYAANKRMLFTMPGLRNAVVNLDDPYALSLINSVASGVEISTYSLSNKIASVYASSAMLTRNGFEASIVTPVGAAELDARLLGYFNFSNVLAVVTILISYLKIENEGQLQLLCDRVSDLKPVSGRMEIVGDSTDITAVVDYAHTPDGLRSALTALRDHFKGKIWCVFGCGGNRDRGKRPLMGEIAEQFADRIILTDDNPRNEAGDEIVQHIRSGMRDPRSALVIRDRAGAIDHAIKEAAEGDVILVAGKGHENYQESNGARSIFSDANHVRLGLKSRSKGMGS